MTGGSISQTCPLKAIGSHQCGKPNSWLAIADVCMQNSHLPQKKKLRHSGDASVASWKLCSAALWRGGTDCHLCELCYWFSYVTPLWIMCCNYFMLDNYRKSSHTVKIFYIFFYFYIACCANSCMSPLDWDSPGCINSSPKNQINYI